MWAAAGRRAAASGLRFDHAKRTLQSRDILQVVAGYLKLNGKPRIELVGGMYGMK